LIGYRAAGKTSLGKLLARRMGLSFVDADREFELRHGPIATLFDDLGEPVFRDMEAAVLEELIAANPSAVLATGGGAVLRVENRTRLRGHGLVIWLEVPAWLLAERLRAQPGGRPPLTPLGLAAEVDQMLTLRAPLYHALADVRLDASTATIEDLAARVEAEHNRYLGARGEAAP
jgi:shikimate kinase